jgi:hypothetical protein
LQSCTSFEAADTSAAEPVSSENGAGVADTVEKKQGLALLLLHSVLMQPGLSRLALSSFALFQKLFLQKIVAICQLTHCQHPGLASPQCIGPFTGTAAAAACLSASPPAVEAHVQGVGHASLQCESVDSDSDWIDLQLQRAHQEMNNLVFVH